MGNWLRALDRVLRGEATRLPELERGHVDVPAVGLCVVLVALGMIYGACMGTFALFREQPSYEQLLASTLKVPALFFLTLIVTFPSLYVFNALVGSRLTIGSLLKLLIASLGVNLAVLASLGPIVAFFSVSTTSYAFMVLLNVVVFTVAGTLGLSFLLQTLHRLTVAQQQRQRADQFKPAPRPTPTALDDAALGEPARLDEAAASAAEPVLEVVDDASALDRLSDYAISQPVKLVFRCWVVVFGLVGAQMGWVMRPFIGNPNQDFTWFRERESNFLQAVWQTLLGLFG